ncbi:MAG: phospholipid carrier-dependent glycosyltransferase [Patescibacteria group bacterium]|nr:phospholipid carrier-dependent glycosyltransferase [Patescibacteria group bacterium]
MPSFVRKISSTFAVWTVILLCFISFSLMFWASRTDSAIDDELAHIPAGYGYVHNLDYRLNPEHPPLVKALALLPVLFLQPNFPTAIPAWTQGVNNQWDMGRAFLYQSGNDANAIIRTARIMPILITLLTVMFVFLLARRLLGNFWALLPTALFSLSPIVLAHGHYVTTDVGAAFGVVFATYFFLRFLEEQGAGDREQGHSLFHISCSRSLFLAGIAFGVAMIAKFSTPFLIPLFLFMALLWGLLYKRWHIVWKTLLLFAVGYLVVVYPIYLLFTLHYPIAKQVSDTTFILGSFANGPTPAGTICHGMRCLADLDIWMSRHYATRPFAEYLLGLLMVLQRSDAGNTIYYLGHVVNSGGWTYFPVLYLLKEPIPTLIIVLGALLLGLWRLFKSIFHFSFSMLRKIPGWARQNFAEISMFAFVALYWGYSMHSPLNIGIRHILPTLPFIYILAAGAWKKFASFPKFELSGMGGGRTVFDSMNAMMSNVRTSLVRMAVVYGAMVLLIIWLLLETLFAAPYFLSYFNEFGGGVWNGYHYVTDSNYDWGQDLLRLQQWIGQQNKSCAMSGASPSTCIDKIAVDYFGGGDPNYYLNTELGTREVDWNSSKGNPAGQGIHWFAVSVNQLEGGIQPVANGETRDPQNQYSWLTALRPPQPGMGNVPQPDFRVGTSIFIYHL